MIEISTNEERLRTRKLFDRQLRKIEQDALRMGALVENSCVLAHKALFERDLEAATKIDAQDKQIDKFYRQIEVECIEQIALQSPVTRDLRFLNSLVHMVRDLERIGDYAENLGEIAIKLLPYPTPQDMGQLQVMSNRVQAMLALSLEAIANFDAEAGREIKVKDDAVDSDYEALYTSLTKQTCSNLSCEPIMLMVLAIHHLERMADHATNIGKRVSYVVTGDR
jgi:phosphate transport system protein